MPKRSSILLLTIVVVGVALGATDVAFPVLLIWPNAQVTAMAGAGVALDGASGAISLNPAGLACCENPGGGLSYGQWLPGLIPDMYFWNARAHVPLRTGMRATVGADVTLLDHGYPTSITWEPPDSRVWRGAFALRVGVEVVPGVLAAGLGLKALHSALCLEWVWAPMPELGISPFDSGTSFAVDAGLLWRAAPSVSVGAVVANIGPDYQRPGNHDLIPMASVARAGLCWTALDQQYLRVRVLPEVTKPLPGAFSDSLADPTFERRVKWEWRKTWRSLAVEATAFQALSARIGYFADLAWNRGGFLYESTGGEGPARYGLCDVLTRKGLGRLKSVGLCWGLSLSLLGTASLDFGSDASIYYFQTRNWKLSLTVHDPRGLIDLWRGEDRHYPPD
jgi:hypothetical protein